MNIHEALEKVKEGYHVRRPSMYELWHIGQPWGSDKNALITRVIKDGEIQSAHGLFLGIDDINANDYYVSDLPRLIPNYDNSKLIWETE